MPATAVIASACSVDVEGVLPVTVTGGACIDGYVKFVAASEAAPIGGLAHRSGSSSRLGGGLGG